MNRIALSFTILLIISACAKQEENQTSLLPYSIAAKQGQQLAKGHVFHDANENRILDDEEKGIAGVAVSNGVDLVQTIYRMIWKSL